MIIKKNSIVENVQIEGIVAEGKCISKINGQAVFVSNVAPGDVVDIKVIRKKKKFLEAIPLKFHSYSDKRSEPFCEHFGTCGGCKWQHINYDTQVYYKESQVKEALEHIGKVTDFECLPVVKADEQTFYRNKMEYTFSNNRWLTREEIDSGKEFQESALGFHVPRMYDKIVDINTCHLQTDSSNVIRNFVRTHALEHNLEFFDIRNQEGLLRNLIVRTSNIGEIMVILQAFRDDQEDIKKLLTALKEAVPAITSLLYIINSKGNETFFDLDVHVFDGKDHIIEEMEGLKFKVGPKTFYQTNSNQAYKLYSIARDFANFKGDEIVYDLYTGAGSIANFIAKSVKKVVGVESVESAIEDAKVNAELNNIDNTVFFAGDMKDIFTDDFVLQNGRPDIIITDPPRAGMHENVINQMLKLEAPRIVYISCNPATQARDVALLTAKYKLVKAQAVDMFPQTHHVESVALLELK